MEALARNASPAPAATGGGENNRQHGGLAEFQRTNPPFFSGTELLLFDGHDTLWNVGLSEN